MSKLAFAAIVKGSDKEAEVLNNLLGTVAPHVDGIFITITQPNEKVKAVAELYNAVVSDFEWCKDFAKARNYNFAQVPKDYDYILWGDADDEFQNLALLKPFIETNKADAYVMQYQYDFDTYGMPTVVHPKTQVVANDGTFTWVGAIHEDLQANRDIDLLIIEGVNRVHRSTKERVKESSIRNLEISKASMTGDPRDYWNLANAYTGAGMYHDAIDTFKHFITVSGSDMEIYMATLRVANMFLSLGDLIQSEEYARKAIGLKYDYPDAFHTLAQVQKAQGRNKEAVKSTLEGISKKPPVDTAMVYNPRDYDYNPMMTLAHLYWDLAEFEKARVCLEACAEIQPKNRDIDKMIKEADKEDQFQKKILETIKVMSDMNDEDYLKTYETLSEEEKKHPIVLQSKNLRFVKTETSGKDIVYYCGQTTEWTPAILEKGIGGSEEAVINLSKEWAKLGYNVTVYNNCGDGGVFDGVTYKPWYTFNYRDKQDVMILWRQIKPLDYEINAKTILVDVHDVMQAGEFTEKRLKKITKVLLKSDAHRELFPNIPDEKIVIVPNGMDTKLFSEEVERDPHLIINTSSPDRALSALIRIFPKIKAKEPRAKMKWAYGFDIFDLLRSKDKEAMAWRNVMLKKMEEAGIENLGKISHKEVAKLTKSAGVMLYPTHFMEIDCVSARKAQLGGAHVVCTDFGALKTTVKYGYKIPTTYTKDNWCPPYALDMADDPERDDEYVEAVLKAFKNDNRTEAMEWAKSFTPDMVAKVWEKAWLV
jgi:tetratricopeptide (TPR) repeat protein